MSDNVVVISYEKYQFWVVDYARREVVIVERDGTKHTAPLDESDIPKDSTIAASIFDWEKWWVTIVTSQNHGVDWAGFNPETGEPRPRRPVVYLDQNKWSQLALARVAPERFTSPDELLAAYQLIDWARDDGIVLPLSSAHLLETSALFGEKRYDLGVTIADLSNGWQMRHPIDVIEHEATLALGDQLDLAPITIAPERPIITTEPGSWQRTTENFGLGPAPLADTATFMAMLTAPAVVVSLLIEPDALKRDSSSTWVDRHQAISNQVRHSSSSREVRRQTALRRFWNENLGFYRRAMTARYGSGEAPTFSNPQLLELFNRSPMISMLSALFVQRFLDHQSKWHRNDLVDLLFLTCAAAHYDYVVTENRTGTQLRQSQRARKSPVTVFTNLTDLVEALDQAGVMSETERRAQTPGAV